ncbi:MAG: flagellar hook protein FlgE [Gammaproteobacteria bacterium]|nr:flagellar hook protein FlgE [Gammaproteobacteria bacterium]MDH5800526.1 flagellar hook protein FlgE [Gammaproteobacteria bacterium]
MPFRIALSGLNAASTELKVTGNNIANAATVGFKRSRAEFADVYAVSFGGTTDASTGNGVRVSTVNQQFSQGSIDFTDRSLDVAISGQGFFVVDDASGRAYTRNGSFHVSSDGTVINNHNQRLQVFPVVGNNIPAIFNTGMLTDLQLATTNGPPNATQDITAGFNLDASATPPVIVPFDATDPTTYNSSTSLVVYDSLGSQHTASLYYVKTAVPNQWESYMYVDGNEIATDAAAVPPAASPITLTFNTDGTLATPISMQYAPISSAALGTGAAPMSLNINYASTTQYGGQFAINTLNQNGYASGRLSGLDIDDEGVIFARYTNGQSSALGKMALANFANPEGLRELGQTNWAETFDSGSVILGEPGTGSLGLLQSGALEASNVDIAASLVSLITSQRNFQANAQVISTADTITQTIINI